MKTGRAPLKENLRIVWAITAKDVLEALRNKNTITVLLSTLFIMVMYRALPVLEQSDAPPNVLLYDAGGSDLVAALEDSQAVKLYTYRSEAEMKRYLANGQVPELGLVVPAGFDQALSAGEAPELTGYVLHWVDRGEALELKRLVESEASRRMGAPVRIRISMESIAVSPESGGLGVLTGLGLGFVTLMTGMILPPHLMLEEKQAGTMDVLQVSPASAWHIVVAKALTGLFYCFLALGLAFVLNHAAIAHWPLAGWTALCGALFAVSLGLFLGTALENRQQLILWAWVLLVPLMLPMLLSLMNDQLPDLWLRIFEWVPSTVMFRLFRAAFSNQISLITYVPQLAYVFVWALAVLMIVVWLVRRQER